MYCLIFKTKTYENLKFKISFFLLIFITLVSCNKNNDAFNEENTFSDGIKVITYNDPNGRSTSTQMLSFPDIHTFRQTIENLETQMENHDNQFLGRWPNLDDDALALKEQEEGYEYYQPIYDFFNTYGYTKSLFNDYKTELDDWLNKPDLDSNNDPILNQDYYSLDESEMALLNPDGAVKIGGSIYKVLNGGEIEITDGDIDTYLDYAQYRVCDPVGGIPIKNNVKIGCTGGGGGGGTGNSCFSNEVEVTWWNIASDKKLRGKINAVFSNIWGSKLKAKSRYYKKGFLGIWYNRRANLTAALDGDCDVYPFNSCGENSFHFDKNINFNYRHNKYYAKYVYHLNVQQTPPQQFLIQDYKIKGYHKRDNFERNHALK